MQTEMVIRMQASSDKGQHSKAMKIAAAIEGVESVTLAGEGRNLLRVVGEGVDSNHLTSRLRRKVGHADIVELRTLQPGRGYASTTNAAAGAGYHSAQAADAGARGDAAAYGGYSSYTAASYSPVAADQYHRQQQLSYEYYPPAPYATTVVHHEYTAGDPTGCSIM
uniref:HMA domain-containing protein n=1 Tax=Aegilops tauschii subsp. strangulata TaxID=200361 RepID=A0A453E9I6_AEGTS